MTRRHTWLSALALTLATIASVFTIDGPIASAMQPSASRYRALFAPFMNAIEWVFAFELSKFATGFAIVLAALIAFIVARWRPVAWLLLFTGVTHLVTRLIAGVLKNVFLRLRPYEAVAADGTWRDRFFTDGGSSFPSGHAAHFWALFFALALAFPRLRIPALILAIAISVSRVMVNDHYVSDVLASAAIAACVAAALRAHNAPHASARA